MCFLKRLLDNWGRVLMEMIFIYNVLMRDYFEILFVFGVI